MKSANIGVILFLLISSTFAGTFIETFDDGNLDGWQELIWHKLDIGDVSWEITNGELRTSVPLGIPRLLTMGDERWHDYVVEFDVKPVEKHGHGSITIAARVVDSWAVWCRIGDGPQIGPEGGSRATCLVGNFHHIKDQTKMFATTPNPLLRENRWSTLKLKVEGDMLTFSINGKNILGPMVLEFEDGWPSFLAGGVGLGLAGYTAFFDNMRVTGNTVLDNGGFAVAPKKKLATTWGKLKRF